MVRCYDCGLPIRDDQIVRCFVITGITSGFSGRAGAITPTGRSERTYYHKVNLCPACAASRDKRQKISCVGLLATCVGFLAIGLFAGTLTPKKDIQTKDVNTSRLSATVTWTGPPGTRKIGLRQGGIPGSIPTGDYTFNLAPDAPWPNVRVGQKVECVMERRNGQWVVSRVSPVSPDKR